MSYCRYIIIMAATLPYQTSGHIWPMMMLGVDWYAGSHECRRLSSLSPIFFFLGGGGGMGEMPNVKTKWKIMKNSDPNLFLLKVSNCQLCKFSVAVSGADTLFPRWHRMVTVHQPWSHWVCTQQSGQESGWLQNQVSRVNSQQAVTLLQVLGTVVSLHTAMCWQESKLIFSGCALQLHPEVASA